VRKFKEHLFTVWRCSHCRSLHSKEQVDLAHYYAHYPLQQHRLDYFSRIAYGNRLAMLKRAGVRKHSSILDSGCGSGLYVQYLREKGYGNTVGWDPYLKEYADTGQLSRQYDVVTSHDVIEHVESPAQYLRELVALVKPGGVLVLGTPNADRISTDPSKRQAIEFSQPYHRHILSEQALRALARDHQLETVETSHRFYFDSLYPGANTRFIWEYLYAKGGFIDAGVEPVDVLTIYTSPRLLFFAFFGYFFPPPGNILLVFRKGRGALERDGVC
jgi:SAM-dependent methyltransferase